MFKLDLFDKADKLIISVTTGSIMDTVREDLKKIIKLTQGSKGLYPSKYVLTVSDTKESFSWKAEKISKELDDFIDMSFYGACTYNQFMSYIKPIYEVEREKLIKRVYEVYNVASIDAVLKLKNAIIEEYNSYLDNIKQMVVDEVLKYVYVIAYYGDVIQYLDDLYDCFVSSYPLRTLSSKGVIINLNIYEPLDNYIPLNAIDKLIADSGILEKMYNIAVDDNFLDIEDQAHVLHCLLESYFEQEEFCE